MNYIGWLIAGLLLASLCYLQLCRTAKPQTDNRYEAQVKRTVDTVAYYERLLLADSSAIELAITQAEQAYGIQAEVEDRLEASTVQVFSLTNQLRDAKKQVQNSKLYSNSWIYVPPNYVSVCDSLASAAGLQTNRIVRYMASNDSLKITILNAKTMYEKKLKTESAFNAALRNQLDSCQLAIKEPAAKKRSQVYGGVNLIGNKTYFLDGGQANLTLLTKRNTMFEVNASLIHGNFYFGGGTKFLLSFQRK